MTSPLFMSGQNISHKQEIESTKTALSQGQEHPGKAI
jgi:hypothetical protein